MIRQECIAHFDDFGKHETHCNCYKLTVVCSKCGDEFTMLPGQSFGDKLPECILCLAAEIQGRFDLLDQDNSEKLP